MIGLAVIRRGVLGLLGVLVAATLLSAGRRQERVNIRGLAVEISSRNLSAAPAYGVICCGWSRGDRVER
jgi:hypothetical protein